MTLMGQQRLEVHQLYIFCNLTSLTFSKKEKRMSFLLFHRNSPLTPLFCLRSQQISYASNHYRISRKALLCREKGGVNVWGMSIVQKYTHQMSPQLTTLPITKNINPLGENLALLSCPSFFYKNLPFQALLVKAADTSFSNGTTSSYTPISTESLAKRRKKSYKCVTVTYNVSCLCFFSSLPLQITEWNGILSDAFSGALCI